jgi:hypothetical protein
MCEEARMRVIRIVILCSLQLGLSEIALGQAAQPFHTRNLNPPLAIFGLPTWETATDTPVFTIQSAVANHYRFSRRDNDTLLLDGETLRIGIFFSQPLGERWSLSAALPLIRQSGGFLDDAVDAWHSAFNMPDGARNQRPEDVLMFRMANAAGTFFSLDDDERGLGDLQIGFARRLGTDGRFVARTEIKIPTGDEDMLAGSGAVDWSATILSNRDGSIGKHAAGYYWGAGFVLLGQPEVVAFTANDYAVTGVLGGGIKIFPRIGIRGQLDFLSAAYDTELEELGQHAVQATIGGWWEINGRSRLEFGVDEDIHVSTAPDVVLHLTLRWSW